MKKQKTQTAAELLKELEKDPEYQKRLNKKEGELRAKKEKRDLARKPILKDFEKIGIVVNSEWDLAINSKSSALAIPVILSHLDGNYERFIKEGLYRSLRTPFAKGLAGKKLIEKFKSEDEELKWVVGFALEEAASEKEINDIVSLIQSNYFSDHAKSSLPSVISNLMGKNAIPILMGVLEKNQNIKKANPLVVSLIEELGNLKAIDAKELIETYKEHNDSNLRIQVKKALKKIKTLSDVVINSPKGIVLIKDNRIEFDFETSIDLDLESLPRFLEGLENILQINPIDLESLVLQTDVEETKTYEIEINKTFGKRKLYFQIFMDDINTSALFFYSKSKQLIKSVNKVIDNFR